MEFSFNKKYFVAAVILFLVEIFIAIYVQDSFIRPYGGDFLVVILLYCVVKSYLKVPVEKAIFGVLLFSWIIEALQYLKIINLLGIEENKIFSVILGNHFEWLDLLLYTMAGFVIFGVEQSRLKFSSKEKLKAQSLLDSSKNVNHLR